MSDTADYWKERYEAVCQMAREDREELKAQIESLQVDVSAKQRMIDSQAARLDERLAEIESLQRTNEELRAGNDQFAEINSVYESAMATDRQRIKGLRAAAITPEMREAAEKWLEDYAPGNTVDYVAMALSGRVIIHALLKETVEPSSEGEQ